METTSGFMATGARKVWRYQRLLWWMLAVNFALSAMSAAPVSSVMQSAAHSAYARSLVEGFDLAAFAQLSDARHANLGAKTQLSGIFALLYFAFTLFLTGGTLEAYASSRKPGARQFFDGCGRYLWRWVRLLVWMALLVAPLLIAWGALAHWTDTLSDDSPREKLGFWVLAGGTLAIGSLLLAVRLWFDLAQVLTVVEDEHSMRRALGRSLRICCRRFWPLFGMFAGISLLSLVIASLAFWLWLHMPAPDFRLSFVLWELVLASWIGMRLWQRASEMTWYQRWVVLQAPAPLPLVAVTLPPSLPQPESPGAPAPGFVLDEHQRDEGGVRDGQVIDPETTPGRREDE